MTTTTTTSTSSTYPTGTSTTSPTSTSTLPNPPGVFEVPNVDVVDDFEDNNNGILETDGRRGFGTHTTTVQEVNSRNQANR
jgi:hypothetical protein